MQSLPSFALLRSFEAAADYQSFTAAAEALHISQGAISRQVRELEGIIGTPLFRKAGRGVALTPAGQRFAQTLGADLARLRRTIGLARSAGASGRTLSLAVLPTFASRWLAPRLPRFQKLHPEVQIDCRSRSEPFDLVREGIDAAIHFGAPDWIGGTLTEMCPEDLVAVASPVLVDRYQIARPRDCARLPLLHLSTRANAWSAHFASLGLDPDEALSGASFDQFSTIIAAAVHGLGATLVPTYLIETELAQGTLVIVGQAREPGGMYYAVHPTGVENPLAESFVQWVVREARASSKSSSRHA